MLPVSDVHSFFFFFKFNGQTSTDQKIRGMFINSPLVVANFTVKSHRGDLRVLKTTTNRSRIEPNVNLFQWRNSPERQVCTAAGAGRIGALPLDASRDVETAPRPPAVPRANRTEVNIFNIFSPKKMFSVFSFFFPP